MAFIRKKEVVSNSQEIQYNWIREKLSVSCSFRKRIVIQTIQGNVDDTLAWLNICRVPIFIMGTEFKLTIKHQVRNLI